MAAGRPTPTPSLSGDQMTAALAAPVVSRTSHFALQHLRPATKPLTSGLSTDHAPERSDFVDNSAPVPISGLGFVIPKRHAKRAVTRNLIRRQMREATRGRVLTEGAWVIRLRAPFEPRQYSSAASNSLRQAVRSELEVLFGCLVTP